MLATLLADRLGGRCTRLLRRLLGRSGHGHGRKWASWSAKERESGCTAYSSRLKSECVARDVKAGPMHASACVLQRAVCPQRGVCSVECGVNAVRCAEWGSGRTHEESASSDCTATALALSARSVLFRTLFRIVTNQLLLCRLSDQSRLSSPLVVSAPARVKLFPDASWRGLATSLSMPRFPLR